MGGSFTHNGRREVGRGRRPRVFPSAGREGRTVVDLRSLEHPVIVVGADRAFEERVRAMLSGPSDEGVLRWDRPLHDASDVQVVAERSPAAVILGDGLPKSTAFNLAAHFDSVSPAISVLVVAVPTPDTWRRALAAGTRGLVCPDASDEELRRQLDQALEVSRRRLEAQAAVSGRSAHGRVITVISPKGGSGKTIVSANLAAGLARRAPDKVALLDLDALFGDVSSALGLAPEHTMADAVAALDELDADRLQGLLTRHESGLYALCAPQQLAPGEVIPATAFIAVIGLLAHRFDYLVIDTPAGLSEPTLAALDLSTDVVLIADMDVPSVRGLRKTLDALDALGMRSPTRHLVLNRCDSRVRIEKEAVAAVTGISIAVEVPSSRDVPVSLNEGRPLVLGKPRSPAGRGLAGLVEHIISTSADGAGDERAGDLWGFMLGLLERFVEREGHALVPAGHRERGVDLGGWVAAQRRANRRGELGFDRVRQLSALAGWSWDPLADEWAAGPNGAQGPGEAGPASRPADDGAGEPQGADRDGERPDAPHEELLSGSPAARAETSPGGPGNRADNEPPDDAWEDRFRRVAAFARREGHVPVPFDDGRGGARLDRWVAEQRRAYRLGYIPPERVARLQALPGWSWDPHPDPWEDFFGALEQFAAREGHTRVPRSHREAGRELGRWADTQRAAYHAGGMPPGRAARLQALPGWDWGAVG